jgi:hypothetical protein
MPFNSWVVLNNQFNAPRSYIQKVVIEFDGAFNFAYNAGVIDLDYPGGGHLHIVVRADYYLWTSNVYSAEHVWDDALSYNTYPGSGGPVGFLAFLFPQIYHNNLCMTMRVQFTAGTPVFFDLPDAPSSYWRQLPPFSP